MTAFSAKEAWPFYRTISGVRLCWELEEPKGPQEFFRSTPQMTAFSADLVEGPRTHRVSQTLIIYRGTSLIRNNPLQSTTLPQKHPPSREGGFSVVKNTPLQCRGVFQGYLQ